MSIVFDEIIANVEPEPTPEPDRVEPTTTVEERSLDQLRRDLARLKQRETRLRAD